MVGPSLRFACVLLAVAVGAAAGGCSQDVGERCEVARDCKSGLFCDLNSGDNSGGVCKPNNQTTTTDAGAATDAAQDQPAAEVGDAGGDGATETGAPETAVDQSPGTAAEVGADASTDAEAETPPPVDGAADAPAVETGG